MSSNTIGALNYRVGANVDGFVKGMTLSRSEMRTTKREMLASRTDAEKLGDKLNTLEKAYKAGAITLDEYHRTQVRLRSETAEAKAMQAQHAADLQKASQLTSRLATDEERLAAERAELIRLKPHLSEEAYARALADVEKRSPAAIAAAEKLEQARVQQAKQEQQLASDLERDRQKAAQLTSRLATEEERLAQQRAELERLKPHLSEEAYARALADVEKRSPAAIAAAEKMEQTRARQQRREQLLNQEMERGRQTTRSVENATEKYAREVRDLDKQLRRGTITQETHRRSLERLNAERRQATLAVAGQIPVVGRLTSALSAGHPALVAVGVAATVAGAAFYAGTRAVRAFGREVFDQFSQIDDTSKMASRLGMLPQNLVALQLASAEVAGSGVDVEMSMQRMTRRFAEAAKGGGEAKDAIKQLGLDAAVLSKQDPAEIFRQVADEIRKIEDPAEQVRLAFKLFDSEGVGMVNLLREGGDALERYQRLAQSKGLSFTAEEAARVAAANDALGRVKMTVEGLARTTAVDLGPAVTRIAKIAELGIPIMVAGLKQAADYYVKFSSALGMGTHGAALTTLLSDLPSSPDTSAADKEKAAIAAAIAAQDSASVKTGEQFVRRLETLRKQNLELRYGAQQVELMLAAQSGVNQAGLEALRHQFRINNALKEEEKKRKELKTQQETLERERKQRFDRIRSEGEQLTDSLRTPLEMLDSKLRDYNRLLVAGAIDKATMNRARGAALKEFASSSRPEATLMPTLRAGSDAAYRAVVDAMNNTPDNRLALMQEQIDIARDQAAATEQMVGYLARLEAARGV